MFELYFCNNILSEISSKAVLRQFQDNFVACLGQYCVRSYRVVHIELVLSTLAISFVNFRAVTADRT